MAPGLPNPISIIKIAQKLKQSSPDIVQTWMYHADFAGGIAARLAGLPSVWGIRNSTLDAKSSNHRTRVLVRMNARLANWLPAAIVSNSKAARDWHVSLGYPEHKFAVIPNGFDLGELKASRAARTRLFAEWRLPKAARVIGMLARYDPQKDHATFLEGASILASKKPALHFVLAGAGIDWQNPQLKSQIAHWPNLANKIHLLGPRTDVADILSAFDILVSCSRYGESFPNVVAEAMAMGVPCVVTDIGDSADIVGSTGLVIPLRAPNALANAVEQILAWPAGKRKDNSTASRSKIEYAYSLPKMLAQYREVYETVLQNG